MNLKVYSLTTGKVTTKTLPKAIAAHPVNRVLLAQAVRVYLSRQRQGTKAVKTRGMVTYSTHKLWRQKGTGRARHGSRRAPIFVGGGVAHGPTGTENYRLKLTKNMRHHALFSALREKADLDSLALVTDLVSLKGQTKKLASFLDTLKPSSRQRILLVLPGPDPLVMRAVKNLDRVQATQVKRLNTYEVLQHHLLLFTPESLKYLTGKPL